MSDIDIINITGKPMSSYATADAVAPPMPTDHPASPATTGSDGNADAVRRRPDPFAPWQFTDGDLKLLNAIGDPLCNLGKYRGPAATACAHPKCTPPFDEAAAKGASASEVRKRWPRFDGVCPDCNERVLGYASSMHYIMGDW
jgi:hypothetical protein